MERRNGGAVENAMEKMSTKKNTRKPTSCRCGKRSSCRKLWHCCSLLFHPQPPLHHLLFFLVLPLFLWRGDSSKNNFSTRFQCVKNNIIFFIVLIAALLHFALELKKCVASCVLCARGESECLGRLKLIVNKMPEPFKAVAISPCPLSPPKVPWP